MSTGSWCSRWYSARAPACSPTAPRLRTWRWYRPGPGVLRCASSTPGPATPDVPSGSGCGRGGPDEQVQDPYLGEPVAAPGELLPDRSQRGLVAVQVALVAADEREPALCERSLGAEVVVLQVLLDDAVQHGDQRRALGVQRLGHLREADSPDARERVEELPKRRPRHRVRRARQRSIGSDRPQGLLDRGPPLQDRRDLGRRYAGAGPV